MAMAQGPSTLGDSMKFPLQSACFGIPLRDDKQLTFELNSRAGEVNSNKCRGCETVVSLLLVFQLSAAGKWLWLYKKLQLWVVMACVSVTKAETKRPNYNGSGDITSDAARDKWKSQQINSHLARVFHSVPSIDFI